MNRLDSTAAAAGFMGASLHIYHTCPFCWKVRALVRHLNLPVTVVQVNPFRVKKEIAFADDWGKVPVWREGDGTVVVDSTPIMKHIDATHNNGGLYDAEDAIGDPQDAIYNSQDVIYDTRNAIHDFQNAICDPQDAMIGDQDEI